MRSRTTGTLLLLPAAVAAASVVAMTVPASAQDAPPPAPQTYKTDDCGKALNVLSYFKLLPNQPDLGRTLCSMNRAKKEESPYTDKIDSLHTDDTGRTVEENELLGIPVEWPKSLTIKVPTFNEGYYTYKSGAR
ncbi:hypothetical protein ACQPZP_32245 [Spirillospora sp. CA-142024]|uniref:hypothetical protein n=1 Tax=Spirillospora sp. CA-142024 TaxID=3240036 RepID=UPI003D8BC99A